MGSDDRDGGGSASDGDSASSGVGNSIFAKGINIEVKTKYIEQRD